jgi:hypothetical protein
MEHRAHSMMQKSDRGALSAFGKAAAAGNGGCRRRGGLAAALAGAAPPADAAGGAAYEAGSPTRQVVLTRTSSWHSSPWQRRSMCTKDRAPGPAPFDASLSWVAAQHGGEHACQISTSTSNGQPHRQTNRATQQREP